MTAKTQRTGGGKQQFTVVRFLDYMSSGMILFESDCKVKDAYCKSYSIPPEEENKEAQFRGQ